jgi:hypothetical protein
MTVIIKWNQGSLVPATVTPVPITLIIGQELELLIRHRHPPPSKSPPTDHTININQLRKLPVSKENEKSNKWRKGRGFRKMRKISSIKAKYLPKARRAKPYPLHLLYCHAKQAPDPL